MEKIAHWKFVMFVAVVGMLTGLCVAIHGITEGRTLEAYIGLITIGAVCVSWWFWVMFIIRTMINGIDRTQQGLGEIKTGISEVRFLVKEIESLSER